MHIYLIRHPKPLHVTGQCYGRSDVAVVAQEISIAAMAVRRTLPASVLESAPIFTSPLSRCAMLAGALAAPRAAAVDHNLIEMNFGSWEGQSWDALPRDQLDCWAQDIWGYHPGGGENALDVAERWRLFVNRLRQSGGESAVAVTHAGLIRVALARSGARVLSELNQASVAFGSVHAIEVPT